MPKSLFRHAKVTDALEKVFRHVMTIPELLDSAHTDDVAEWLEEVDAGTLAKVCEDDRPDLPSRLDNDLTELELEMGDTCGFLIELLGEGKVDCGEEAEMAPTPKIVNSAG